MGKLNNLPNFYLVMLEVVIYTRGLIFFLSSLNMTAWLFLTKVILLSATRFYKTYLISAIIQLSNVAGTVIIIISAY